MKQSQYFNTHLQRSALATVLSCSRQMTDHCSMVRWHNARSSQHFFWWVKTSAGRQSKIMKGRLRHQRLRWSPRPLTTNKTASVWSVQLFGASLSNITRDHIASNGLIDCYQVIYNATEIQKKKRYGKFKSTSLTRFLNLVALETFH